MLDHKYLTREFSPFIVASILWFSWKIKTEFEVLGIKRNCPILSTQDELFNKLFQKW
jgi:hypothetical protein